MSIELKLNFFFLDDNSYFDQSKIIIKEGEDEEDYLYIWIILSTILVIIIWVLIGLYIRKRYKEKQKQKVLDSQTIKLKEKQNNILSL